MRLSLALLLVSSSVAWTADDSPAAIEAAFRRLWEKPGLVLNAGLNSPPAQARPIVLRALEFTARVAKIDAVTWKPSPRPPPAGILRGELTAHLLGVMPPSTAKLDLVLVAPDLQLDRTAFEDRGSIKLIDPGKFSAVSRIPFDLMAAFNRGSRITASGNQLEVRGKRKVLLFDIPYRLVGPLEIPDRVHIVIRPSSLSLASIPAPGSVREALVEGVNPVFCADEAMGPLRHLATIELDSVSVEPDGVVLSVSGKLRPPNDPEAGGPHHPANKPK